MMNDSPKFEKVMIIDDNNIDLYIAGRMIKNCNFGNKVLSYSSAIEALKYLRDNRKNMSELPEIIFVDIYMPVMSGFEFMEEFDKLSASIKKHCKAFIVSSTIDHNDIARVAIDKNVIAFREKPITKDFLESI